MKNFFFAYIVICMVVPYFYREPFDIVLPWITFQGEWFWRDILVFAGYGIAPCVIFIKERKVAINVGIAFMVQSAAMIFSKIYDDCTYDMTSTIIQGMALILFIHLIYNRKLKA